MILVKLGVTLCILGMIMFPVWYLIETLTNFDVDKLFLSGLIVITLGLSLLAIFIISSMFTTPLKPLYIGE